MKSLKSLLVEIITLVFFMPLRLLARPFGQRAGGRIQRWQDSAWTWALGGAAAGYLIADQVSQDAQGMHGQGDGHHHDQGGPGNFDGGFDGGGGGFDGGVF